MAPSEMTRITPGLAETTVFQLDGTAVPLGTYWAERPTVLVFLRHYG